MDRPGDRRGTSTRTDRGGVVRSAVTASGRAGWQGGAVEVTGMRLVLDDDELLALARAVRADPTAAGEEVDGLGAP